VSSPSVRDILDRLRLHIKCPNVRSDTSSIATATGCKTLALAHQRYLYVNFAIFPLGSAAIRVTAEHYPCKIAIVVSRQNYIHDQRLQIPEFDRRYCRAWHPLVSYTTEEEPFLALEAVASLHAQCKASSAVPLSFILVSDGFDSFMLITAHSHQKHEDLFRRNISWRQGIP
jgi:hypothetical protein